MAVPVDRVASAGGTTAGVDVPARRYAPEHRSAATAAMVTMGGLALHHTSATAWEHRRRAKEVTGEKKLVGPLAAYAMTMTSHQTIQ